MTEGLKDNGQWYYFAFNREIMSYVISESQALPLAMKTLKQAMRGPKLKDALLHSDQGSIYTAK